MYFLSGRLAILKSCSNFSRDSLREGLAGRKVDSLLGLNSCF